MVPAWALPVTQMVWQEYSKPGLHGDFRDVAFVYLGHKHGLEGRAFLVGVGTLVQATFVGERIPLCSYMQSVT